MLKAGKWYKVRRENKRTGEELIFTAMVTWLEDRGDHYYVGLSPKYEWNRPFTFAGVKVKKAGEYGAINHYFEEV